MFPVDFVPEREDYKRIAGSCPLFEKFCSRSKFLFFSFSTVFYGGMGAGNVLVFFCVWLYIHGAESAALFYLR
jgi:hypothetical protein